MEYVIVTGASASDLNTAVRIRIKSGWQPVGSHQVVTVLQQLIYTGNDHKRTEYSLEYSQTMVKNEKDS